MDVRLPDGTVITNVPEGTTQSQLMESLRKKRAADFEASERKRLTEELTGSMSGTEKFLAGAGKTLVDLGRSVKRGWNMVGLGDYDEKAAKEDADLDKPLMDTGAGKAGKFVGDVAVTALPLFRLQQGVTRGLQAASQVPQIVAALPKTMAAVRGAAPYIGAAGAGATGGAYLSPEDMSGGAKVGALAGVFGEFGGRALGAGWNAGRAALDPLTEAGRKRVLKRTIERFATDPAAVAAGAANPQVLVPGVMPTLAEATGDVGVAQLQRAAASASPDVASALAQSRGQQIAGYRSVLDDLAGNDGKREFFEAARDAAADQLYGQARAAGLQLTKGMKSQIDDLLKRPSIQSAVQQAKVLAKERGTNIADPKGSVAGLMHVDDALSDQIGAAARAGNNKLVAALKQTQDDLRGFLDVAAPAYGQARATYQQMSRPINQMAVGQTLRDKALPALTDFGGDSLARVNANSYANALRNAQATARQATGLRSATLQNVLEPGQFQSVKGIADDMARYAATQEAGRVAGSPTAQYLGAQNVIRQFLGPLGIPQSAADSMVGRVATGLLNLPFTMTKSQTEELLGRALTQPGVAAKILATNDPKTIADILRPFAAQAAIQLDTE